MHTRTQAVATRRRTGWWFRRRSLSNLLRMGHCAPTVTQTVLDASGIELLTLLKAAGGLPGGIGNTGEECGGVTAPLLCLGLQHARDPLQDGLPPVIHMGQDVLRRFAAEHGTLRCREILRPTGLSLPCIGVMLRSPGRWQKSACGDYADAITGVRREAFRRLYGHLTDEGFHCAHAVLEGLGGCVPVDRELLDATSAFVGGTAFSGRTCSALTAGVLALGAARGEIEDSRLRVARMIVLMATNGDALAEGVNAFNRTMNMGNRLARWFAERFGGTLCAGLTGCDFGTVAGVRRYVEEGIVSRCRGMAEAVVQEVRRVASR